MVAVPGGRLGSLVMLHCQDDSSGGKAVNCLAGLAAVGARHWVEHWRRHVLEHVRGNAHKVACTRGEAEQGVDQSDNQCGSNCNDL